MKLQSYERECTSETPSLPEFKVANWVTITFSLSWPYFTTVLKNEIKHLELEITDIQFGSVRFRMNMIVIIV